MKTRVFAHFRGTLVYAALKALYLHFNQIGSRRRFKFLKKRKFPIRLNLGSGPIIGRNGWTTIDRYGCDIQWDLRKGIPLSDNTVDEIYSSHLLEHLDYSSLIVFLSECKRVLKPCGTMSVCVPDAERYIRSYIDKTVFQSTKTVYQPAIVDTGSYLDQLNYIAYLDGEHRYMFDQENLVNIFILSGFCSATPREFGHELDRQERDFQSIYCLARKS